MFAVYDDVTQNYWTFFDYIQAFCFAKKYGYILIDQNNKILWSPKEYVSLN